MSEYESETETESTSEVQPTLIVDSGEETTMYETATGSTEFDRYEDDPKNFPQDEEFEPAPLSAEEVPLEDQRKDEFSLLATDKVSIGADGEFIIEKQ